MGQALCMDQKEFYYLAMCQISYYISDVNYYR